MLRIILIGILITFAQTVFTQKTVQPVIPNRFIVQLEQNHKTALQNLKKSTSIKSIRPIFESLNYWLVEYSGEKSTHPKHLEELKKTKGIIAIQEDMQSAPRILPNDAMIGEQLNLTLTKVDQVWDLATGGTTADGQKIVVAVIDDGFDINHEDLAPNHWINRAEIPDNNIDDDKNGYVDDYFGLHVPTKTDNHLPINHGVSVAGIIGAKGNNQIGITGVNWDIEIMMISVTRSVGGSGGAVSDIIEGYQYALNQRKKYNDTKGAQGAFVVVTNYSGGISRVFPEDVPMWCPIYQELGKAGILNVTAVANEDVDIEMVGDIPSLCPSSFLLTVTNTNLNDRKVQQAAFGSISVDLAAPGEDAPSTITQNRYRPFDGTSSAAPHVAGVAALLYSLPCTILTDLARNDPPSAVLEVKNAIMRGVDKLPDLNGITVSGGRLNAIKSFIELDKNAPTFETCPPNVTIGQKDSAYVWNEPVIDDDCGGYTLISSYERGREFRFGMTEVELTVTDLLGNSATCSFEVFREGQAPLTTEFLEINAAPFDPMSRTLKLQFETGSFEVHIIDIYNMLGQLIDHQLYTPFNSGAVSFEINNISYPIGAYFVVVSKAGGSIRSAEKFVIAY